MKGIVQTIVSILVAWAGLYIFSIYIAQDGEKERNKPEMIEVVGKLTRKSYGKVSYAEFEYSYKNITYIEKSSYSSVYDYKTVLGEKYILRVNPAQPTEYTIDNTKPLFTPDEQTIVVIGCIVSSSEYKAFTVVGRCLTFKYTVDEVEYERRQDISMSHKNFKNIKEGMYYVVRCWKENPQRSIIYLDEPIRDSL
jgi:aminopeptidase-like protein